MPVRYSRYFKVPARAFENLRVFNAFIDQDSRFHVDPLLLRGCKIPEFQGAYEAFLDYFRAFVPLVKHVEKPDSSDRFFRQMVKRFTFPELQYTGLGYSKGNSRGTGISGALSIQLAKSAYEIIKAGYEDPEIFALMPLIEDNIGPDRISDMTIAILRKQFLAYTQRMAAEMGLRVRRYQLFYDEYYYVPLHEGDAIHFVPRSFLNDLPVATSFDEIADAANYNERLKARIAQVIGVAWNDYSKFSKSDWKHIILHEEGCYHAAIDYYKSIRGVPYNFDVDSHGKYWDLKFAKVAYENPIQFLTGIFKTQSEKVFNWTLAICEEFKHLIEENRMSELVHRCKRTPDETDWQLLLYMIADAYIEGAGIDLKVSREANPGTGEEDFLFSHGNDAQTVIEIKRSGNSDILHGYRQQLPAYIRSERAENGIFLVIIDNPAEEDDVKEKLAAVQKDMEVNGEVTYPIIYVRGYHQPSASAPKYKVKG